jgi:hypothetical protein
MHSWSTFGAWTNHEQTQTHKIYHDSDLGEAPTFPLIVFSMSSHRASTQMSFCFGTPKFVVFKFCNLGLPQLWKPITLHADLRLVSSLKQSCSPCQDLSNNMWRATCTQGNQGDYRLSVVESQLIPDLSFGHNLCFKCPNGSCEPILDIYVPRDFQWYK